MRTVTMDFDGEELKVEVGANYTCYYVDFTVSAKMSYQAAKISGPPEDCYPEDSECNIDTPCITAVYDEDGNLVPATEELRKKLIAAIDLDRVEESLWEEFFCADEEPPEPDDPYEND